MKSSRQKAIIFGASLGGKRALKYLRTVYRILGFCDNDPRKWGKQIHGLPVWSLDSARWDQCDRILIASAYYMEIFEQLVLAGVDVSKIEVIDSEILNSKMYRYRCWGLVIGVIIILGFAFYGLVRLIKG